MSDSSQQEKEYIEKIAKLEKIIETQRSELEFKVTSFLINNCYQLLLNLICRT